MTEATGKPYDLEERTFQFAQQVRSFVKRIPHTISNIEDIRQLVRASGSVGANYIEANESLGKKDFKLHIRISRKESRNRDISFGCLIPASIATWSENVKSWSRKQANF